MPMILDFCDVGHGSCASIRCPNGRLIVVDTGHNSSPPWRPSVNLAANNDSVELLVLTNFDEDHLSDFAGVDAVGSPNFYRTNWSITPEFLEIMKGGRSMMGPGTRAAAKLLGPPASSGPVRHEDLGGVYVTGHCNLCPSEFVDTNNLSYVLFVSYVIRLVRRS